MSFKSFWRSREDGSCTGAEVVAKTGAAPTNKNTGLANEATSTVKYIMIIALLFILSSHKLQFHCGHCFGWNTILCMAFIAWAVFLEQKAAGR